MKRNIEELNDDNHKPFYYIAPKRTRFPQPAESDSVRATTALTRLMNGKELEAQTRARFLLYNTLVNRLAFIADGVIDDSNQNLYIDLLSFVRSAAFAENESHLATGLIKPIRKLPVGYLQLTSNTSLNSKILDGFYWYATRKVQAKVVTLNSKTSSNSIKQLVTSMLKQLYEPNGFTNAAHSEGEPDLDGEDLDESETELDEYGQVIEKESQKSLFSYSMELFHDWFNQQKGNPLLVIVFENCDSADPQCLNKFLKLIMPSAEKYTMNVVFAMSRSNVGTWINDNINNSFKLRMTHYEFGTLSNRELCHRFLYKMLPECEFFLDETLLSIILTRFEIGNNSLDNLINEIKVCLMIHFYSNSYSRLMADSNLTVQDVDMLRRLPSFKYHVETLLHEYDQHHNENVRKEIQTLLTDNELIMRRFQEVERDFSFIRRNLGNLHHFLNTFDYDLSFPDFYKLIVTNKLQDSKIVKHIYAQILCDKLEYQKVESMLKDLEPHINITRYNYKDMFLSVVKRFDVNRPFKEVFFVNGNTFEQKLPKLKENYRNQMLNFLRPPVRESLLNNLSDSAEYLDNDLNPNRFATLTGIQPIQVNLFNILMEAPPVINHYEFFMAFKQSLDKNKLLAHLNSNSSKKNLYLKECETDDKAWEKLVYSWFLQICNEFLMVGLIREKPRGDHFERAIWKGM